jgi:hypothetical protein
MEVVEKSFMLLPPADGKCRICAAEHKPESPHDGTSLFYHTRFNMRYKRPATWADAIAHCSPEMRAVIATFLAGKGLWTEPPAGVKPISEPIDS